MIKTERRQQPTGSSTPKGVQFLGLKHITSQAGHIAKITKVTTEKPDNFGNPYVVYFLMEEQKYSKGFKPSSPLLIDLVDYFGDDEKKWVGKSVVINKTHDEDGNERLAFARVPVK